MSPRVLKRSGVVIAVLVAALAFIVRDSFHRAAPVERPSALLTNSRLWGSRVRLIGVVISGSVKPRVGGVRAAIRDEHGSMHVVVHLAGVAPDQLPDGGLVEVTGTFGGRAFEAQPSTLVAFCSHAGLRQHC